jgi:hypothetical protein
VPFSFCGIAAKGVRLIRKCCAAKNAMRKALFSEQKCSYFAGNKIAAGQ